MYMSHFNMAKTPFTLTPDTHFFCNLRSHEEALQTLLISLRNREPFIKITGPVGMGKTMLCRKLLNELDESMVPAYIPNPILSVVDLYKLIVQELGGVVPANADVANVYSCLRDTLLEIHNGGKQVVLIIDEAQALSDEGLESIRLLTNLETETDKLMQIVLFGQPELDERLEQKRFLPLKQRIIFSYYLQPLNSKECNTYIEHRLLKAGSFGAKLFEKKALELMYLASEGIPRNINILSHKALLAAFGKGDKKVTSQSMKIAIKDTMGADFFEAKQSTWSLWVKLTALSFLLAVLITEIIYIW